MNSMNKKLVLAGLFGLVALPLLTLAQPYTPLVNIPGVSNPQANFSDFINALYALAIGIAGLLAVVKLIIAGMKYMLSDVVTSKQEAIKDIYGAVFGLLIVLSAYLILYVINPSLTTTDVFKDLKNTQVKIPPKGGAVGGGGVPPGPPPNPAPTANLPMPLVRPCSTNPEPVVNNCRSIIESCEKGTPPGIASSETNWLGSVTITCNYGRP